MTTTTTTELRCAIEHRADESRLTPGRLTGTLMAYGSPGQNGGETFAEGSLTWPAEGIILNLSHDRKRPVMRFIPEVRGKAVVVDAQLPDTQDGRDASTMVRNGTLRGLSVEFHAEDEGRLNGAREIRRARLSAAGLVDDPSYPTARVEVRKRPPARYWL